MPGAERKTVVHLDAELLRRVQQILGTSTAKETVVQALQWVVVEDARRWNIEYLRRLDPINPNELRLQAWGGESVP